MVLLVLCHIDSKFFWQVGEIASIKCFDEQALQGEDKPPAILPAQKIFSLFAGVYTFLLTNNQGWVHSGFVGEGTAARDIRIYKV